MQLGRAWAAVPLPDPAQCPFCLVPLAEDAVWLRHCVHAICAACATVVLADPPVFLKCLLCADTSVVHHPPWPSYLATAIAPVPCAAHRAVAATAYCHTCDTPCCRPCTTAAEAHANHTITHVTHPPASATQTRLRSLLQAAAAAADELVARAAEAEEALSRRTGMVRPACITRPMAVLRARLQRRRLLLLAQLQTPGSTRHSWHTDGNSNDSDHPGLLVWILGQLAAAWYRAAPPAREALPAVAIAPAWVAQWQRALDVQLAIHARRDPDP
jgi:hypothetical protein